MVMLAAAGRIRSSCVKIAAALFLAAPFVLASNMAFKANVSWFHRDVAGEAAHVISLPAYSDYPDADTFLLDFWRGSPASLERHDPWTDAVQVRRVAPGASGQPLLSGENFPLEGGWGYVFRHLRSAGGELTGSHDPSLTQLELPWDPGRANVRHVAIPWHTTWQSADDLLLEAFAANGGISLTAIRKDNLTGFWDVRSVVPDAGGNPVLAGRSFDLVTGHGVTLRLDADPGGGGAVLPLPHS